jgi:predicted molibdopterin-dependent oxidoreductase YjgC
MNTTSNSDIEQDVSIVLDGKPARVPRSRPLLADLRGFPLRDTLGQVLTRPTTVLEAINGRSGQRIPSLCHMDGLPPVGVCRLCMVAVGRQVGEEVNWDRKLQPACCLPIEDGIEIQTIHSPDEAVRERLRSAVRVLLGLLMTGHKTPCMPLDSAGRPSCELELLWQLHGSGAANPAWFLEE